MKTDSIAEQERRLARLREGKLTSEDAAILLREEEQEARPCPDYLAYLRSILAGAAD